MYNIYEPPLDPDFYYPMEEFVNVDELDKYEIDGKELFKKVLHHIYDTGDVENLEDVLDELATIFDVNLPKKNPKLIKKER